MEKIQKKMPFRSKAQADAAFGGYLGPEMQKKASQWAHETPNMSKLPAHVRGEDMNMMQEPQVQSWEHPGCDDKIGDIYVVLKPSPESSPEDLVHQTHAFGMGQFEPQSVHGVFGDEEEANLVAEAACNELYKHLSGVEKKKDKVLSEIEKHVSRLQKEINAHMKEATERPELAEGHHQLAEKKMNIIKGLREKHKMIKASKKELPVKDEK